MRRCPRPVLLATVGAVGRRSRSLRTTIVAALLSLFVVSPARSADAVALDAASALLDRMTAGVERGDLLGLEVNAERGVELVKRGRSRSYPFLPDESGERSASIGTVTDGYLVNGRALSLPGRHHGVLPIQLRRGLLYGTDEMIALLEGAAARVARRHPGAVLWMGNIGREHGGDIPWSVSHNSGRDADIAFYTTDPSGRPVMPPDLLHYRDDGMSREYGGYYRFDVARNWSLVQALIESNHASLQHLFISNGLRALLLRHAARVGAPRDVVDAAAALMRQPGREIPHDDHLHVRIYCSRRDALAGCEEVGRSHAWRPEYEPVLTARIEQIRTFLRAGDPGVRRAALERLAVLDGSDLVSDARRRLTDPAAGVRCAAAVAIGQRGRSDDVALLVERWEEEASDHVRGCFLDAAVRIGGPHAGSLIATALAHGERGMAHGKEYDLRVVAARAAARAERAEPVPRLIDLLAADSAELAESALFALRQITNHDPSPSGAAWSEDSAAAQQQAWRRWYRESSDEPRGRWIATGFSAVGYDVTGTSGNVARALVDAVDDRRRWISWNAQRSLMRLTGNHPNSLEWPARDARIYWSRWVRRNPYRVRGIAWSP